MQPHVDISLPPKPTAIPALGELEAVSSGSDCFVRRRLSLWDTEAKKYENLLKVYRHWEALRPDGMIPDRNKFDLLQLKPVMAATSLIDVSADNPADYTIRLLGREVHPSMSPSKQRLGSLPSQGFRDMLIADYYACRSSGVPLFHEMAIRIDYMTWPYVRLVLPFARDGRNVNELMVCSEAHELSELVQRLQ